MSIRLALSLLLLCASLPLAAHDIRMLSANGGGSASGCQDDAAAQDDDTVRPASAKPSTQAVKPVKAKPGVRRASDNIGDIRPPRWHSFLPGMFR
jgi:hypothetical protein